MSNKSKLKERFSPRTSIPDPGNGHSHPPMNNPGSVPVADGLVAYPLPEAEAWKMTALESQIKAIQDAANAQLQPLGEARDILVRAWMERFRIPPQTIAGVDTAQSRLLVRVPTEADRMAQEKMIQREEKMPSATKPVAKEEN